MANNLRIPSVTRGNPVTITVNGAPVTAYEGETVHAALLAAGILTLRDPGDGGGRGIFCGMGICYDCLVTIDRMPDQRACMTPVRDHMEIVTHGR